MKKIAVIGAGASGMLAAIFAARQGCKVTIFEKQKKIGRKLGITGNGRCNITNKNMDPKYYHGHNPKFVYNVLARFGLEDTVNFFKELGLPFVEGDAGKLFPYSLQAASVVDFLGYELSREKIDLCLHRRIDKIIPHQNLFKLVTAGNEEFNFDAVVLAAGGAAYGQLGGSRYGYQLAASLGHHIFEPFPVILPINIPLKKLHRLEGIKWDLAVNVKIKNKIISAAQGELLFTKYGISGPAALQVSCFVNEAVLQNKDVKICLDFFPQLSETNLKYFLDACFKSSNKKTSFALEGILKKRMPQVLLEIAGLDPEKKCLALSEKEKSALAAILKNLELDPGKERDFSEAVTTAGGVDVNEIDPATMESKKVPRLYITGELLDIDGASGGYNLQFAWSTGAIAGMAQ